MALTLRQPLPLVDLPAQRRWAEHAPRWQLLFLGLLLIPAWQLHFRNLVKDGRLPPQNYSATNSGIIPELRPFTYFYYYLGLYPVVSSLEPVVFSRQGAEKFLEDHGRTLMMENVNAIRWGDHGRIWLYFLEAVRKGGYRHDLSLLPPQQVFWTLSLMMLFAACWALHFPLFGCFLVLFLGSNPHSIHELFMRENMFGLPVAVAVFVLAIHLPFLFKPRLPMVWRGFVIGLTAVLLGTVRQLRLEDAVMALSVVCLYAGAERYSIKQRILMAGAFMAIFGLTLRAWDAYFDAKYSQALQVVTSRGGAPFPGPVDRHHMLWHSVWCGLGDFDTKYGYEWSDNAAARFAGPILVRYSLENPEEFPDKGVCYDVACKYIRFIFDFPQYRKIVREKVLHDIQHDPLWYAGILARRVKRILFETTPVRLSLGSHWIDLPFHGLLLLPVAGFLAYFKKWRWLAVVLFTLPLALPALAVFSGRGNSYYPIFPQITAALLCCWLAEWFAARNSKGKRKHA